MVVCLKEGSLHSTKDYINAPEHLMSIHEVRNYLETQVLIALVDNVMYNHCINTGDVSNIRQQILHIVPMIGPLHVFLHEVFGRQKVLARKPKPYNIICC